MKSNPSRWVESVWLDVALGARRLLRIQIRVTTLLRVQWRKQKFIFAVLHTHTHTRNLPSPINRTPGEQEGKNQIQSGYWFGGVFENGRELCVHLHTPHHVKAHFCQKQPQFLFKGVSEAHEAAAGELSCLLCCSRTVIAVPLSKVLQVTAWVKLRLTCLNPTFAEHEYHCKTLQQRPRLQNPPSCHKHWGVHMGKYKQTADFSGLVLWYAACSFRTACLLRFAFLAWDSMSLPSKDRFLIYLTSVFAHKSIQTWPVHIMQIWW